MKKKSEILIYPLIIIGLVLVFTNSCKKEEIPVLTTSSVTDISQFTVTCGGNITSDGGSPVTVRGVCWGTGQTPTFFGHAKTIDGSGTGSFTSAITNLNANTIYYVRAYAINSAGTGYGSTVSFTTLE